MNKVNILINGVSAKFGGQKTVLNHFFNYAFENSQVNFYFFISDELITDAFYFKKPNIFVIKVKKTNGLSRIKWDLFGLNRWVENSTLKFDYALSLQNTGFYLKNTQKGVLLHNILPFKKVRWSIFRKQERKMWILQKIYKPYQKLTINKNYDILVQNDLMYTTVGEEFKKNNIKIIEHNFESIQIINEILYPKDDLEVYFYPSDDYIYKNHKMIVDSVIYLTQNEKIIPNIKIIFTLNESSWVYKYSLLNNVINYFEFRGRMDYDSVLNEYNNSILLFTSEIESLGLPLLEARKQDTFIISFSHSYVIEILGGYNNKLLLPFEKDNYNYNLKQIIKLFSNSIKKRSGLTDYIADIKK